MVFLFQKYIFVLEIEFFNLFFREKWFLYQERNFVSKIKIFFVRKDFCVKHKNCDRNGIFVSETDFCVKNRQFGLK